jgi:hypothetical protein
MHRKYLTRARYSLAFVLLFPISSALAQQNLNASPNNNTVELPADLAIVPADTDQLLSINFGAYWTGPEAESLKRLASTHPVVMTWSLKEMTAQIGVDAENLERVLMIRTRSDVVVAATTRQPYDSMKVLATLVPNAEEKSAAGKKYVYSPTTKNSVYLLNERTFVASFGSDLQSFLNMPAPSKRDAAFSRIAAAIAGGAPFALQVGPAFVRSFAADQKMQGGPYDALAKAQDWEIIAAIDKGLTIKLAADFATKEEADAANAPFKLIGDKLSWYLGMSKTQMAPFLQQQAQEYPNAKNLAPQFDKVIDAATDGLKTIQVTSDKNRAEATVVIKTDQPIATTVLLLTLSPRGAKQ